MTLTQWIIVTVVVLLIVVGVTLSIVLTSGGVTTPVPSATTESEELGLNGESTVIRPARIGYTINGDIYYGLPTTITLMSSGNEPVWPKTVSFLSSDANVVFEPNLVTFAYELEEKTVIATLQADSANVANLQIQLLSDIITTQNTTVNVFAYGTTVLAVQPVAETLETYQGNIAVSFTPRENVLVTLSHSSAFDVNVYPNPIEITEGNTFATFNYTYNGYNPEGVTELYVADIQGESGNAYSVIGEAGNGAVTVSLHSFANADDFNLQNVTMYRSSLNKVGNLHVGVLYGGSQLEVHQFGSTNVWTETNSTPVVSESDYAVFRPGSKPGMSEDGRYLAAATTTTGAETGYSTVHFYYEGKDQDTILMDGVTSTTGHTFTALNANGAYGVSCYTVGGVDSAGWMRMFSRSGTTWSISLPSTGFDLDDLLPVGHASVAELGDAGLVMNGDGDKVCVGIRDPTTYGGVVFYMTRSGSTWSLNQTIANIAPECICASQTFGQMFVLTTDNNMLTYGLNSSSGDFELKSTQSNTVLGVIDESLDYISCSYDGGRVSLTTRRSLGGGTFIGNAYVFTQSANALSAHSTYGPYGQIMYEPSMNNTGNIMSFTHGQAVTLDIMQI